MSAVIIVVQELNGSSITAPAFGYAIPQKATLPCIVVTNVNEGEDQHLKGATGTFETRVSVACHTGSPDDTEALAEAVKGVLGDITNKAIGGRTATIWKAGGDASDYNDARDVFRRIVDFTVRWSQ